MKNFVESCIELILHIEFNDQCGSSSFSKEYILNINLLLFCLKSFKYLNYITLYELLTIHTKHRSRYFSLESLINNYTTNCTTNFELYTSFIEGYYTIKPFQSKMDERLYNELYNELYKIIRSRIKEYIYYIDIDNEDIKIGEIYSITEKMCFLYSFYNNKRYIKISIYYKDLYKHLYIFFINVMDYLYHFYPNEVYIFCIRYKKYIQNLFKNDEIIIGYLNKECIKIDI